MLKRKIGLGKTALKLNDVSLEDETVQGVIDAMNTLGGHFPEYIRSITINREECIENPKEPWIHTRGICHQRDDKSRIDLYRNSIIRTSRGPGIDVALETKETLLHEIDHANHGYIRHVADWYEEDLDLKNQENNAEMFAMNNLMRR